MPWTPMAVSAWRTSSSLNGLMIATTSFMVRADTLVWSEGMAGWQKAGEIPGLMSRGAAPPTVPQPGAPPMMDAGGYGGGALSIDLPLLPFLGRLLLLIIGSVLVIPSPWT